jgi:L-rhamnose-H+ transport protein
MQVILGIIFHFIGGFASGSFYIPFKNLKEWSWESGWIVGGIASWIFAPWIFGFITVNNLTASIQGVDSSVIFYTMLFGVLWGFGGLTYGLTMRYLGVSLGVAVALGFCAAFGTLIPPIWEGKMGQLLSTGSGIATVAGALVCVLGIGVSGVAGMMKEKELDKAAQQENIKEFDLKKGLLVGTFCGIMSACFAFGLSAGAPIAKIAEANGTDPLYKNNAILPVILIGGFLTNFIWCMILNSRNKSFSDYTNAKTPLSKNYMWALLAGVTWYFQFFFYGMGQSKMGKELDFASWTLHMAFIIIVGTLWGLHYKEWKGVSSKTMNVLYFGLGLIIFSTMLIGYGSYLASH